MNKLANLKNQLLSSSETEELVTVNQRHLIDKILARYSTEFTIFRELLQNSNDAFSTKVEIVFNLTDKKVNSIEYKNNGKPFIGDGFIFLLKDWSRLRKIAEGNPDEQKIGLICYNLKVSLVLGFILYFQSVKNLCNLFSSKHYLRIRMYGILLERRSTVYKKRFNRKNRRLDYFLFNTS